MPRESCSWLMVAAMVLLTSGPSTRTAHNAQASNVHVCCQGSDKVSAGACSPSHPRRVTIPRDDDDDDGEDAGLPEEVNITREALSRGYAVVAISSQARFSHRCWGPGDVPAVSGPHQHSMCQAVCMPAGGAQCTRMLRHSSTHSPGGSTAPGDDTEGGAVTPTPVRAGGLFRCVPHSSSSSQQ
jgi:hypothetical protein